MGRGNGQPGALRLDGFDAARGRRRSDGGDVVVERRLEHLAALTWAGELDEPLAALEAAAVRDASEPVPAARLRALLATHLARRVDVRARALEPLLAALGRRALSAAEGQRATSLVQTALLGAPGQPPRPELLSELSDVEHGAMCRVLAESGDAVLETALACAWQTPLYASACARLSLGEPSDTSAQRRALLGHLDNISKQQVWWKVLGTPTASAELQAQMARHALRRVRARGPRETAVRP